MPRRCGAGTRASKRSAVAKGVSRFAGGRFARNTPVAGLRNAEWGSAHDGACRRANVDQGGRWILIPVEHAEPAALAPVSTRAQLAHGAGVEHVGLARRPGARRCRPRCRRVRNSRRCRWPRAPSAVHVGDVPQLVPGPTSSRWPRAVHGQVLDVPQLVPRADVERLASRRPWPRAQRSKGPQLVPGADDDDERWPGAASTARCSTLATCRSSSPVPTMSGGLARRPRPGAGRAAARQPVTSSG
jgi:hypothetical protein